MTSTLTTNTISTAAGFNGTTYTTTLVSSGGGGGGGNSSKIFYTSSPNNYSIADSVLSVNGTDASLTVKGKCIINGRDLEERLNNIEKVLGIPEVDGEMFTKYPRLKKKYDDYINELAKLRTWDALKR